MLVERSSSLLCLSWPVILRRCAAFHDSKIGEKVSGRKKSVRISVDPDRINAIHSVHRHPMPDCSIHAPAIGENAVP